MKPEGLQLLQPGQIPAGLFHMTRAGHEMSRLATSAPHTKRIEQIMNHYIQEGMTVKREALAGDKPER